MNGPQGACRVGHWGLGPGKVKSLWDIWEEVSYRQLDGASGGPLAHQQYSKPETG